MAQASAGDGHGDQRDLPRCLTPELYAARPDYVDSLAEFVRSRPMPPVVDAFLRQSEAVLTHDVRAALALIQAPTLITFGRHDLVNVDPFRRRCVFSPMGSRAPSSLCSKTVRTPRSTRTLTGSTNRPWRSCSAIPGSGGGGARGQPHRQLPKGVRDYLQAGKA